MLWKRSYPLPPTSLLTWRPPIASLPTDLHPDMVWWDDSQKQLWLAELTVCFETLFEEARERKEAKYTELVAAIEQAGYNTTLITLVVGSQGALVPHLPGFTTLVHELAISQRDLSSLLHQCCQACSHHRLIQNLVCKDHIELKNYLAMYM